MTNEMRAKRFIDGLPSSVWGVNPQEQFAAGLAAEFAAVRSGAASDDEANLRGEVYSPEDSDLDGGMYQQGDPVAWVFVLGLLACVALLIGVGIFIGKVW